MHLQVKYVRVQATARIAWQYLPPEAHSIGSRTASDHHTSSDRYDYSVQMPVVQVSEALRHLSQSQPMQEDVEGYACLSNRSVRRSEQRLFLLVLVDWSEGSDRAPIQSQWRWRSTR